MKASYRPEIDGLRALAVLSVVIYHLEFQFESSQFLSGGFIGVDIFFVISGYLISKILINELINTNKICIKSFYIRRARRILPVLFFILFIFFIIGYFFVLPPFLKDYSLSSLSTIFFVSNFYFLFNQIDYGNIVANLNPLLHTWTLSVEEQFYIIFPFILLIVNKYFKKKLLTISFILFLLSLVFNLSLDLINVYTNKFHQYSFYLFPSRAWELLMGVLITLFENNKKKASKNSLEKYLPDFGLIIIILSLALIELDGSYLSLRLLIPCVGVALVIFFSNTKSYTIKILSSKLPVNIGLISYSIYLWHFPLISLINLNEVSSVRFLDFNFNKTIILILIIFLSIVSYKFVEKPFRSNIVFSTKKLLLLLTTILIILIAFITVSIKTDGLKFRYNFYYNFNNYELNNRISHLEWSKPLEGFFSKNSKFNKDYNKKNILIIGNSFAVDYFNMFNENSELYYGYNFALLRIGTKELIKFKDDFKEFKNSDLIILGTKFDSKQDNLSFDESFDLIKEEILLLNNFAKKEKKKILIFLGKPEFSLNAKDEKLKLLPVDKSDYKNNYTILDKLIHVRIKNNQQIDNKNYIDWEKKYYDYLMQDKIILNKKLKIFLEKERINFLNPFDYSCDLDMTRCDIVTEKYEKIYFDYAHYTTKGAKYFGTKIHNINWINFKEIFN
tara:strand:- start:39 stop:2060 length:2022 start_codon:yes stop_codon:yes gene_type:complete